MSTNSLPATEQVEAAVARYSALLYRHSLVLLAHRQDAEDAVQETFLRYMRHAPSFRDAEHEKAWLLTVNTNLCICVKISAAPARCIRRRIWTPCRMWRSPRQNQPRCWTP